MNDGDFRCDLPEGHRGMHERIDKDGYVESWIGMAYHSVEPVSTIGHIKYTHVEIPTSEGNNAINKQS